MYKLNKEKNLIWKEIKYENSILINLKKEN